MLGLKLLDRVVSGASFCTAGVYLGVILHIVDLWQYYVLYKIRCNPGRPVHDALPSCMGRMCQCGLYAGCGALVAGRCIYVPPR